MSEKMLYLPPGFDSEKYLLERLQNAESEGTERVQNNFAGFGGWGGPTGMSQVNPFNLPGSAQDGSTQMLSNVNTIFDNLRYYFISNFRQVLSEAYVELGLVSTIVDVPVDDAFRGGVEIKSKQLSPEQIEELQISVDRDDDLNTVAQTAKWNRLFGGAGTLILTDQDPRTPLDLEAITEDSPLEFRAVDLWELFWDRQNTEGYDPQLQSQDFSYYNYYGEIIHKSRVMRMKGNTAPSFVRPRLRGWGFSVVEQLVRSINQYLKSTDLAFELLDEYKIDVYKIKNLVNTLMSPQGANKVRQRIAVANQIKNYQNAIVMDQEDDYQQKTISWTGFSDIMKEIRMQIAADMRIPLTKLFGISAAGFNSGEDDIEVYNAMVESSVRNKVKYQVLRLLEIKCQKMFGMVPSDLSVTFKSLRMVSGVDEEGIKTSKFNRLLQAVQGGQITQDQFVDACNKGQLLDILLDKVDMLNPDAYSTVKEDPDADPNDPKSESDPGANRQDVRSPRAWEIGGAPKGLKKKPADQWDEDEAPPEAGEDKDQEYEEEVYDKVKNPKNPFGKPGTQAAGKDTNPDEPDSEQEDRQPLPKKEKPLDKPKGEKAAWRDEKTPELEDHDLKLEKPKKESKAEEGDAPEPPKGKAKVAKPGTEKKPKKATPPEPTGHTKQNRISNSSSKTQEAIEARTTGNQPGIVAPRADNGKFEDILADQRKLEGVKVAVKDEISGKVTIASGVESHSDLKRRLLKKTGLLSKADGDKFVSGFVDKAGRFLTRHQADKLFEFGTSETLLSKQGKLHNEDSLADEADMVEHPKDSYEQPHDKALDSQKDRHKNLPKKFVAVVGVVTKDRKYVLTGQRRDTGLWVVPGGKVEPGEEWVTAACRELQEEAGIEVSVKQMQQSFITQKSFHYPDHTTVVRGFVIELDDRIQAKTTEDPDFEVKVWRWVPLAKGTAELQAWNRHAQEDIIVDALLKPKYRGAE